jgi:hypothetical protein
VNDNQDNRVYQNDLQDKYAAINGRDVSPPIRLGRDTSQEKAKKNVIDALHQRYNDLRANDY